MQQKDEGWVYGPVWCEATNSKGTTQLKLELKQASTYCTIAELYHYVGFQTGPIIGTYLHVKSILRGRPEMSTFFTYHKTSHNGGEGVAKM